jgi:hypothetical protein
MKEMKSLIKSTGFAADCKPVTSILAGSIIGYTPVHPVLEGPGGSFSHCHPPPNQESHSTFSS